MNKEYLNYFSESEKHKLHKFSKIRNKIFRPLVVLLDQLGFTANKLTIVSISLMAGFVYFAPKNMFYALGFVLVHILLDGMDGPLARYQKKDSNQGALVDIANDQGGIIITVLSLIYYQIIDPFWAALYILSYTIMVTFIILLNQVKAPVRFIIRSKYMFYITLLIDAIYMTKYIEVITMVFAIYMTIAVLYLFNKFRCSIS